MSWSSWHGSVYSGFYGSPRQLPLQIWASSPAADITILKSNRPATNTKRSRRSPSSTGSCFWDGGAPSWPCPSEPRRTGSAGSGERPSPSTPAGARTRRHLTANLRPRLTRPCRPPTTARLLQDSLSRITVCLSSKVMAHPHRSSTVILHLNPNMAHLLPVRRTVLLSRWDMPVNPLSLTLITRNLRLKLPGSRVNVQPVFHSVSSFLCPWMSPFFICQIGGSRRGGLEDLPLRVSRHLSYAIPGFYSSTRKGSRNLP